MGSGPTPLLISTYLERAQNIEHAFCTNIKIDFFFEKERGSEIATNSQDTLRAKKQQRQRRPFLDSYVERNITMFTLYTLF